MPLTWWPGIVIVLKVHRVIRMWLLLDYIIILSGVFDYRVFHSCNLFESSLHFLIKKMIIAKRNYVAVVDRENWALIDVGEFFNQLFRDLTVNIHQINASS